MKDLVEGYNLLDNGLRGYILKNIFITYDGIEIIAESKENNKLVNLQFINVSHIYPNSDSVNNAIYDIKLKKTESGKLDTLIEKTKGLGTEIIAKQLIVKAM